MPAADPAEAILEPRFQLPEASNFYDYFGLWAIWGRSLQALAAQAQGTDLHLHMRQQAEAPTPGQAGYTLTSDGVAQIQVRGAIMKVVPSMAEGTSSVDIRRQLRQAAKDPAVKAALLTIDSPGGTAKGNQDLAAEAARFASQKPLFAFVEDLTASAAVALASQATKRYANNATAVYGAMGTYAVLEDLSGRADKLGIKVHVIKAGQYKGMGEAGTQVTPEQLEEVQRLVDRLNEAYLKTISDGLQRPLKEVRALADGRAIMAADAVAEGLINGIQSFEETYAELVEMFSPRATPPSQPKMRATMSEKTPATLAELKAKFPRSSADWRETQLEAEASVEDAAINYAAFVEEKAEADAQEHAQQLEEAKNAAAKAAEQTALGHQPLTAEGGHFGEETGDPVQDFDAAVRARLPQHCEASLEQRQAAIAYVIRKQPALHRAYLSATNADAGPKVRRLLDEKYETAEA